MAESLNEGLSGSSWPVGMSQLWWEEPPTLSGTITWEVCPEV